MRPRTLLTLLTLVTLAAIPAAAEVSTTAYSVSYSGDGATVAFVFAFPIYATTDLRVVCRTTATGAESLQVLNSAYTMADNDGDGDYTDASTTPGGTVTFVTAPATGVTVHLLAAPPLTQTTDLDGTGYMRLGALEDAIDKLALQNQHLRRLIERSLLIPESEGGTRDMNVPASVTRASGFLGFDDDGDVSMGTTTDATLSASWTGIVAGSPTDPEIAQGLTDLGFSDWGQSWIAHAADANALTDLGFSAWAQTILADATAPARRASLLAQKRGAIDVTEAPYNASGDGVTDDTTALQAAENAADANGLGKLYFPPGRYLVSATVDFNDVSIYGAGADSVTVRAASDFGDPLFKWDETSHITVEGMSFTGVQTHAAFVGAQGDARAGVYFDTCQDVMVSDCNFADMSHGVDFKDCTDFHVVDNRFIGMFDPANFGDGSNYNYASAIRIGMDGGCTDGFVARNYVYHWAAGVTLTASSSRVHMESNNIRYCCENGIYVSSGNDNVAANNTVMYVAGYGIKMRGNGHRAIGNRIDHTGNYGTAAGGVAITGTASGFDYSGAVISDNIISNTTSFGILLSRDDGDTFTDWTIRGNTITDTGDSSLGNSYGMGLYVNAGCSRGVISGNIIAGDGASSLHGAVALLGSASIDVNEILFDGNIIYDVNQTGLVMFYTKNVTVSNNIFREIPEYGIYCKVAGSNVGLKVEGNTFDNQTAAGVTAVYGDSSGVAVSSVFDRNVAWGTFATCVHGGRYSDTTNHIGWNWPDSGPATDCNNVTADIATWNTWGTHVIDSSGAAVDAVLNDGQLPGQHVKFAVKTAGSNITIRVGHHKTSDPEVIVLDTALEYLELVWDGTDWVEVAASGQAYP